MKDCIASSFESFLYANGAYYVMILSVCLLYKFRIHFQHFPIFFSDFIGQIHFPSSEMAAFFYSRGIHVFNLGMPISISSSTTYCVEEQVRLDSLCIHFSSLEIRCYLTHTPAQYAGAEDTTEIQHGFLACFSAGIPL